MFWRGVMGYLPVQIVQAVAGFGAVIAFTRLLPAEAYGHYALAFSVASLTQTAFLTWNEAATARFTAGENGSPDHFRTLQRTTAVLIALVLLVGAPVLLALPIDPALKLAVGAGVLAFALRSATRIAQERMKASGEVRAYALTDVAITGGGFLLGLPLAMAGWGGAAPLAAVGIVTAACLAWVWPAERRRAKGGQFDPERLKRNAAYGLPVALSLVASLALATTDRFVIAAFLDESAVGAYHAGYSVGNRLIDIVFVWLSLAGAPALVAAYERGGRAAMEPAARQQAQLIVLMALPAATGLALVSEPLIGILVGEQLRAQAAAVTPWIAVAALFSGLHTHYFLQAFTLGRRTGLLAVVVIGPAMLNIGLNLLLIPRFGLVGAAWSTAFSYGLGAIVSAGLGRRAVPMPIPWAVLGRAGLAAGAMAAVVSAIPDGGGWAELLVKSSVGAAVYGAVLLAIDGGLRRQAREMMATRQLRSAH